MTALIVVIAIIALCIAVYVADQRKLKAMSPEDRAAELKRRAEKTRLAAVAKREKQMSKGGNATRHMPISQVGDTSSGSLACPRCHGSSFKKRRSTTKRALLVGTAGLTPLTHQSLVQCVTCGAKYKRG